MKYVSCEVIDHIGYLRMKNGKSNPIFTEFCTEMREALEEWAADVTTRAICITGDVDRKGGAFSSGFDVFKLAEYDRAEFREFLHEFQKLYLTIFSHPNPTVAGITGSAIAGGCILALSAEFRLAVEGDYHLGLTEIALGLPVPAGAGEIMKTRISKKYLRQFIFTGTTYSPSEAYKIGAVNEIYPKDIFEDELHKFCVKLSDLPHLGYSITKRLFDDRHCDTIRKLDEERTEEFLNVWFSSITQERVEALRSKLKK
ncbi:MAG: enoyl-CoA hydratase/isomerase family protein [Planctomycetes bacterium]|nr:enoyl-CoA hydratase/isomerase family protein [Planctomycetota bacterium]